MRANRLLLLMLLRRLLLMLLRRLLQHLICLLSWYMVSLAAAAAAAIQIQQRHTAWCNHNRMRHRRHLSTIATARLLQMCQLQCCRQLLPALQSCQLK